MATGGDFSIDISMIFYIQYTVYAEHAGRGMVGRSLKASKLRRVASAAEKSEQRRHHVFGNTANRLREKKSKKRPLHLAALLYRGPLHHVLCDFDAAMRIIPGCTNQFNDGDRVCRPTILPFATTVGRISRLQQSST